MVRVLAATIFFWFSFALACTPGSIQSAMTDTEKTFIREGFGEYGAPRGDEEHTGVDIITNASQSDPAAYAVSPIAPGTVAYAQINGSEDTGFGNVIVIDHGNDCYSLYAHLANRPFTSEQPGGNLEVALGESVGLGQIIGYFVDIKSDVDSTGNARRTAEVARHQVHFELIQAPSGRSGQGSLRGVIFQEDGVRVDPTALLQSLGYEIRTP